MVRFWTRASICTYIYIHIHIYYVYVYLGGTSISKRFVPFQNKISPKVWASPEAERPGRSSSGRSGSWCEALLTRRMLRRLRRGRCGWTKHEKIRWYQGLGSWFSCQIVSDSSVFFNVNLIVWLLCFRFTSRLPLQAPGRQGEKAFDRGGASNTVPHLPLVTGNWDQRLLEINWLSMHIHHM